MLRWQLSIFAIIAFCFATYFALYSLFVFETPLTGERVIAGFECTANVRDFVAPILRETCPFLSEEVLAAAQYEVEQVWTPASVRLIEIAMFAVWSLFFVATTFLFGISIAILHRSDKRRQAALGRNG